MEHIHPSSLRDPVRILKEDRDPVGTPHDFNTPRILSLWRHPSEAGCLGPVLRSPIVVEKAEFQVCGACSEDQILAAQISARFRARPLQPAAGEKWVWRPLCLSIQRGLTADSNDDQWNQLYQAIAFKYAGIWPCPGTNAVQPQSRRRWTPREQITGMVICDACHHEHIAFSLHPNEFVQRVVTRQDGTGNSWSCDLADWKIKLA
ncbi:hypothetical protein JAAARDRAFT_194139 [Jaapia argillacea MUCL 33604]|uniref:Uncharacterized protein n=1 Tax=Jaapia argillacea MUCL 33604 TaxID=933084 RepID=A0A067PQC1_9AGAM|nr:hypothetical protein JAAARDRAFT_194139 [Jaapia argillacea MUCL 33604]